MAISGDRLQARCHTVRPARSFPVSRAPAKHQHPANCDLRTVQCICKRPASFFLYTTSPQRADTCSYPSSSLHHAMQPSPTPSSKSGRQMECSALRADAGAFVPSVTVPKD
ncbi:hypothetical protein BAUCODRAFT_39004 [Baudoinia panamericana UAMH 10762]|uniref:Uncharacterized protein n=1 Tax=Baudoinia panamericana (strain UAMH 10762) TaxID=717646 RepID=M2MYV4_BAUPA|nr:uncharacterized protein BAUCODRAFT_39004 [Baudoinia panamericana UAMH 10762]EMC91859.1 hypothetical protein BAUCODRAFT_39004 [Baudoinia panamericana UAMH 10762]